MRKIRGSGAVLAAALAAAVAIGACTEPSGLDSIEDTALRDMALVAADETLESVSTWALPFGFGAGAQAVQEGDGPRPRYGRPGGRAGLGADGSGTVTRAFYDAEGNEQDEYDELLTERIELETVVEGEVARDGWSGTVYRERRMTVTGLSGEETHRTFNGDGRSEVTRSRHTEDGDRTHEMSGEFAYADVVVPIPGSDPRYPVSGTITRSMTGTRTDGETTETHSLEMTITFDGDETAVAVVNGETFEIDLSAKEGRRPWRGRRPGG